MKTRIMVIVAVFLLAGVFLAGGMVIGAEEMTISQYLEQLEGLSPAEKVVLEEKFAEYGETTLPEDVLKKVTELLVEDEISLGQSLQLFTDLFEGVSAGLSGEDLQEIMELTDGDIPGETIVKAVRELTRNRHTSKEEFQEMVQEMKQMLEEAYEDGADEAEVNQIMNQFRHRVKEAEQEQKKKAIEERKQNREQGEKGDIEDEEVEEEGEKRNNPENKGNSNEKGKINDESEEERIGELKKAPVGLFLFKHFFNFFFSWYPSGYHDFFIHN